MAVLIATRPQRLYARSAAAADRGSWSVERDIAWRNVDREKAYARPEILVALRDAALIESYHPVNLARLLKAMWDDVDACVVFSLELYEGFKHFHALRMYLEAIDYTPSIEDAELVDIRRAQESVEVGSGEIIERLVEFMLSEHLAHYFFRRLGEKAEDPVLADLLEQAPECEPMFEELVRIEGMIPFLLPPAGPSGAGMEHLYSEIARQGETAQLSHGQAVLEQLISEVRKLQDAGAVWPARPDAAPDER